MSKQPPKVIVIRSWPKMLFLWPTALICLVLSIAQATTDQFGRPDAPPAEAAAEQAEPAAEEGEEAAEGQAAAEKWTATSYRKVWGMIFLVVLALNLMVITFDFPRTTSLTLAIGSICFVLALILVNQRFEFVTGVSSWVEARTIYASTEFYITLFCVLMVLFVAMFIITRFDYWELTTNEIIHHHGLLGDLERFSSAGLKLNKEISDLFEFVLAGSGRIVLTIPGVQRPVVLENVLRIGYIMKNADYILNARYVRMETDENSEQEKSTEEYESS